MALRLFGVFVRHVQIDMVVTPVLHLGIDGTCHDVARCQRQTFIVLLHEFLAVQRAKYAAIAAHRFRNQERRTVAWMEERRGMELHELHVLDGTFGAIDHRDTVARRHQRIRGRLVDSADASGSHKRDFREERVDLPGLHIHDISAITFDMGRLARNGHTQMVLRQDFDGEVVLEDFNIGVCLNGTDKAVLYFCARIIFMVQDAEFRMSAFAMEVEISIRILVEIHTPTDQFLNLLRRVPNDLLHGGAVAQPISGNHRVFDMLVEVIYNQVRDRSDAALCEIGVRLFQSGLAHEGDASFVRHLQGKTHSGDAGTYY